MLKNKIEALLFSSGKRMSVDEIAKLCNSNIDDVKEALQQLKWDYEEKKSSLMIIEEGNYWKITVKEEHLPLVKSIVTETELTKTLMETLAVIAFKYPIKQSNLIKIRTNKAVAALDNKINPAHLFSFLKILSMSFQNTINIADRVPTCKNISNSISGSFNPIK